MYVLYVLTAADLNFMHASDRLLREWRHEPSRSRPVDTRGETHHLSVIVTTYATHLG